MNTIGQLKKYINKVIKNIRDEEYKNLIFKKVDNKERRIEKETLILMREHIKHIESKNIKRKNRKKLESETLNP